MSRSGGVCVCVVPPSPSDGSGVCDENLKSLRLLSFHKNALFATEKKDEKKFIFYAPRKFYIFFLLSFIFFSLLFCYRFTRVLTPSTVEKRFMTISLYRYRGLRVRLRLKLFSAAKPFGVKKKDRKKNCVLKSRILPSTRCYLYTSLSHRAHRVLTTTSRDIFMLRLGY